MDELDCLRAQCKELKYALDECTDEKKKIGIMYEELYKEKEKLEKKIAFLEGEIAAY